MKNPFKKNVCRVLKKQRCIYNPCEHLRWSFSVNILNGFIFSQYKLHHRSSTGLYIGPLKMRSKSSRLLQRIAFLVFIASFFFKFLRLHYLLFSETKKYLIIGG